MKRFHFFKAVNDSACHGPERLDRLLFGTGSGRELIDEDLELNAIFD